FPRHEWFLPREGLQILPSVLTAMGADEATCREAAFDEFAHTLSQLLHGEQAALQLCGQLTNACPTMDAKFYAASQVIDEARHVALGLRTMRRTVRHATPEELVEMDEFSVGLLEALNATQHLDMLRERCPKYRVVQENVDAILLSQRE